MFEFGFLWIFILLPLPIFVRFVLKAQTNENAQIWLPLAQGLNRSQDEAVKSNMTRIVPWIIWTLLLTALAKPLYFGEPVRIQQKSRDLMLSVDLSGSMQQTDMKLEGETVQRVTLVKSLLKDFIKSRRGDRLGLILFADHPYLQTPLTFDLKTIEQMLDETFLGLVGEKTSIGGSIALSIKSFVANKNKQRVLILITDGANTAGTIDPIQAATQAAKNNITIYTIGIGADSMIQNGFFMSQKINPSADLDEKTLKAIASITSGKYFRARSQQDLENIYKTINALEPVDSEFTEFRPEKNLFFWPLSFALILLLSFAIYLKSRGQHA